MNKTISKKIFIKSKIRTPKFFSINKIELKNMSLKKIINKKKLNFPIVSKPSNEGSSLGVEICKNKEKLFKSVKRQLTKYDELIIEEYKMQKSAVVINGSPLGVIELIPKRYFTTTKLNILKKLIQHM